MSYRRNQRRKTLRAWVAGEHGRNVSQRIRTQAIQDYRPLTLNRRKSLGTYLSGTRLELKDPPIRIVDSPYGTLGPLSFWSESGRRSQTPAD